MAETISGGTADALGLLDEADLVGISCVVLDSAPWCDPGSPTAGQWSKAAYKPCTLVGAESKAIKDSPSRSVPLHDHGLSWVSEPTTAADQSTWRRSAVPPDK